MLNKSTNGGYIWLLVFFVGIVLILVFVIQGGYLAGSDREGNFFDKVQGVIDQTKETKKKLEGGYRFDPDELERSIDEMN